MARTYLVYASNENKEHFIKTVNDARVRANLVTSSIEEDASPAVSSRVRASARSFAGRATGGDVVVENTSEGARVELKESPNIPGHVIEVLSYLKRKAVDLSHLRCEGEPDVVASFELMKNSYLGAAVKRTSQSPVAESHKSVNEDAATIAGSPFSSTKSDETNQAESVRPLKEKPASSGNVMDQLKERLAQRGEIPSVDYSVNLGAASAKTSESPSEKPKKVVSVSKEATAAPAPELFKGSVMDELKAQLAKRGVTASVDLAVPVVSSPKAPELQSEKPKAVPVSKEATAASAPEPELFKGSVMDELKAQLAKRGVTASVDLAVPVVSSPKAPELQSEKPKAVPVFKEATAAPALSRDDMMAELKAELAKRRAPVDSTAPAVSPPNASESPSDSSKNPSEIKEIIRSGRDEQNKPDDPSDETKHTL